MAGSFLFLGHRWNHWKRKEIVVASHFFGIPIGLQLIQETTTI